MDQLRKTPSVPDSGDKVVHRCEKHCPKTEKDCPDCDVYIHERIERSKRYNRAVQLCENPEHQGLLADDSCRLGLTYSVKMDRQRHAQAAMGYPTPLPPTPIVPPNLMDMDCAEHSDSAVNGSSVAS
eukprot:10964878-Heterocapsa_arctica.AAC.1